MRLRRKPSRGYARPTLNLYFTRNSTTIQIPVLRLLDIPYFESMGENRRTYTISEAARELGISAVWLRKGEQRDFFPPARRNSTNGQRYYTREDIERLKARRAARRGDEQ